MVDIPGNSSTTRTIIVGGSISDSLETTGDHDWIRIQLTAGQSISVLVDGLTLEDSYLRIRDINGNVIYENDDISAGVNRDSLIAFTATYTGTYFIDVAAWVPDPGDEPPGYTGTGTYTVSVSPYTPPPLGTVQELADYLVSGHWGGDDRHFNVTPGGSITVNLTALTAPVQTLAIAALQTWTDIIGVNFVQVGQGGQITFDDNQEGAFSTSMWSNGIITSSHVNVSVDWTAQYGTALNSYSFQTFIHEIGHALGLGHQGGYNGDARYPYDAVFQNDGWPMSVMSYFSPEENTYFAGQGYQDGFVLTPMIADIMAMSGLYGLSTITRTGDTVYGVGTNAGQIYNASLQSEAYFTIFDSGGTDTLNFSTFSFQQRINLNPETFSFAGNRLTFSIGRGVAIENVVGGSGTDFITGNSVNNVLQGGNGWDTIDGQGGSDTIIPGSGTDTLTGGMDADEFRGTIGELSGDTIMDLGKGDKIVLTNANSTNFNFSLDGSTLFFTGGTIQLVGFTGQLQASAAVGGGVQLTVAAATDARNDFNGDGISDVLWRSGDGYVTNWLGQGNGDFFGNYGNAYIPLATSWQIEGTGDFNGDGKDDILWRNADGAVTNWLGQANGGFAGNAGVSYHVMASNWEVAGTGDFNGDGIDDVLWRSDDGIVTNWLGQGNGDFFGNYGNAYIPLDTSWQIEGTGDFNGDGLDDILWRNTDGAVTNWLGQANGGFAGNAGVSYHVMDNLWQVQPDTSLF